MAQYCRSLIPEQDIRYFALFILAFFLPLFPSICISMRFTVVFFIILFGAFSASAQEARRVDHLTRAESYLRNLHTLKADFVQISNSGSRLSGKFYLSRPGRLRFDYNEIDDFVVADGNFLYYYDAELGEQSNAPIGQTIADFLLREDIRLSGEIKVTEVKNESGFTYITLVQRADPAAGSIRMIFQNDPYKLRKWRVVDAQGYITEVYLQNIETGMDLPRKLFIYIDPSRDVIRYNQ
jgi:outer membrane lipoprotein-sorting protein